VARLKRQKKAKIEPSKTPESKCPGVFLFQINSDTFQQCPAGSYMVIFASTQKNGALQPG
jgi:hypothetical protein